MDIINKQFLEEVAGIIEAAQKRAKFEVNLFMVYGYFDVECRIIEEEQNGESEAEYDKYILCKLSEYLINKFGKDYTVYSNEMKKCLHSCRRKFQEIMNNDGQISR